MAARKSPGNKESWRKTLEQLKVSGQSVSAFSRERGLSPGQVYAWRRRLGAVPAVPAAAAPAADFLPVKVLAPAPVALEIELRNGRVLRLHGDITPGRLAAFAQALEGGKC